MTILEQLGHEMVNSNNHGTRNPIWTAQRSGGIPQVFLSEASWKRAFDAHKVGVAYITFSEDPLIIGVMREAIQAAGQQEHPQAKNAYYDAIMRNEAGYPERNALVNA